MTNEASLLRCPAGDGTQGWEQGRIQAGDKINEFIGCRRLLAREKHSPDSPSKDCIAKDLTDPTVHGQLCPIEKGVGLLFLTVGLGFHSSLFILVSYEFPIRGEKTGCLW